MGARLKVKIQPPGRRAMTFRPKLLACAEARELRWLGRLFVPGLFDGEHAFELSELSSGRTSFVQREKFRGLLVPIIWRALEGATRRGFEEMNRALAERASHRGPR